MGTKTRRTHRRGYTLVELMIVISIVGVLAALATYGVRRYVLASKSAEAIELINNIRAAQEQYRDERFRYLDISSVDVGSGSFFPFASRSALRNSKHSWVTGSTGIAGKWSELGIAPSGPVAFGYACAAGQAGDAVPTQATLGTSKNLNYPASAANWYVVRAAADRDGDAQLALFIGSSFTDQIYAEGESE
jgi:prepilin-type N-terminal cleavage/methylation domain-containing protein